MNMTEIRKYIQEFGYINLLKFSFVVVTAFLLYEESYVFFVEKPTHTSFAKLNLG